MKRNGSPRGRSRVLLALSVLPALFVAALALADVAVPPLIARITDLTDTLKADQRAALEAKLTVFEKQKGSQVAVLIVPTTQPETIEQYSIRVVDKWKLGRKRVDDGVLLLVAKDDKKLRIEVGYGLEGAIPDAIAKRIIAEDIVPRFKQGDFYGGIIAGTDRILRAIEGEPPPKARPSSLPGAAKTLPVPDHDSGSGPSKGGWKSWVGLLFIILFAIFVALQAERGQVIGAGIAGGISGSLMWVISEGLEGLLISIGVASVVFIIVLIYLGSTGRGGSGGFSGAGGSSGDGLFSGGGGDFGGGGASGDWGD